MAWGNGFTEVAVRMHEVRHVWVNETHEDLSRTSSFSRISTINHLLHPNPFVPYICKLKSPHLASLQSVKYRSLFTQPSTNPCDLTQGAYIPGASQEVDPTSLEPPRFDRTLIIGAETCPQVPKRPLRGASYGYDGDETSWNSPTKG